MDQIFLQALSVVCPVRRQNFGLSMAANHRRFRDHKGQVSAKGASMPSTCCNELLDVMRDMIDTGGNEFLPFKGFFFDTWLLVSRNHCKLEDWRIALRMLIGAWWIIAMHLLILQVKKCHQLLLLVFHARIHYQL